MLLSGILNLSIFDCETLSCDKHNKVSYFSNYSLVSCIAFRSLLIFLIKLLRMNPFIFNFIGFLFGKGNFGNGRTTLCVCVSAHVTLVRNDSLALTKVIFRLNLHGAITTS